MCPMEYNACDIINSIRSLRPSDWIAFAAAVVAAASLIVSWRTAVYQRKTANDRELLGQMILTLERAYSSINDENSLAPPIQSRLSWLTAARHIATFKSLKTELTTQLYKNLCEEHEEYWRHQFYILLSRIDNSSYFEWNNQKDTGANSINPVSAALVFAFSNWPKDRKDPLDDFSLKKIIQENDLFSLRFRHLRDYIEKRFPHWSEDDRNSP